MSAVAAGARRDTELLETLKACPLCGGDQLEAIPSKSLNSRVPARVEQLRDALGTDFFARQAISSCTACDHLFQSTRPTPAGMELLYADFSATVSKKVPTVEHMLEYVLRDNAQDYVHAPAKTLAFLDEHGLLDVGSALEIRTYGGALPALLRERGIGHVEAAWIQEFDRAAAERMYGIEHLLPFSFATRIEDFTPARERYGLIVMYEGLTHSRDPRAVIRWLADHLEPGGAAVLFREPSTPRYRAYMPLSIVFNNFHLQLLSEPTVRAALAAEGVDHELVEERHPNFEIPLYLDVIVRGGPGVPGVRPRGGTPYGAAFYRSWMREDSSRAVGLAVRVRRMLTRLWTPLRCAVQAEWRGLRGR